MRLNDISPATGSKKSGCAWDAAPPPARARPAAAASRASARAKAAITRSASKAARCRCSAACRRSVSARKLHRWLLKCACRSLQKSKGDLIDLASLKAANLVPEQSPRARIVLSGTVARAVTVKGVHVTKGARSAIEGAGGKIE